MSFDINRFSQRVYNSAKRIKGLPPEKLSEIEGELKQNSAELKGASGEINSDSQKNFVEALAIFKQYDKCLQEDASMIVAALQPSRIVGEFTRDLTNFLKRGERVEKSEKSGES